MNHRLLYIAFTISALVTAQRVSQAQTDSTGVNNSMFINAASDSKPRQISLGLPTNNSSAVQIFEDGLPVTYYIYQNMPYKSWHGGVSAGSNGSMTPFEAAMRYGEINYLVSSTNKTGGDKFAGAISYSISSYGQHKLDVNISGPIARGWAYSLSTYQNFDPGSNHIAYPKYKDRHQFYKGVLSKDFDGRGHMSLVYQHVNYRSLTESFGPFVFVGDGSVEAYNGFDLGHDSYRPAEKEFQFMDFMTGEMRTMDYIEGNTDKTDHLTYTFDYVFDNGLSLDIRSRYRGGTSLRGAGNMSGIDQAGPLSGYTYDNGTPFEGLVQKRMILHFDAFDQSWINNVELSKMFGRHSLVLGLDYSRNHGGTVTSSTMYAHEVGKDPQMLKFKGDSFFNFNTAGEYYDGIENKSAIYLSDNWYASNRLTLKGFLRAEWLNLHGDAALNIGDDKSNSRVSGFNLTKGKITPFAEDFLNGAAGLDGSYRIVGGLSAKGDFVFTRAHTTIFNYGGYGVPTTDPSDTKLIRVGFSYVNSWINLLSQINYVHQSNYKSRSVFQHVLEKDSGDYPAGYTESRAIPCSYGIASLGWVTDAVITPFEGFNLHAQFTIRNPQYRNFVFKPVFSDGVALEYDFSGKNVTNLHKVELTLDPSYSIDRWRFWLSGRYLSKRYINKTNSLFFKGRVETFGGIDFDLNDKVKFSLNLVNLLNQKGASGIISSADLVEDVSDYVNYVMAGTFIRPFTMELGVKVKI